ncbi:hypothetical protein [Amycolatopsis sp. NPDC054798]
MAGRARGGRRLLVATLGLLLAVAVTSAQDRPGARQVLTGLRRRATANENPSPPKP